MSKKETEAVPVPEVPPACDKHLELVAKVVADTATEEEMGSYFSEVMDCPDCTAITERSNNLPDGYFEGGGFLGVMKHLVEAGEIPDPIAAILDDSDASLRKFREYMTSPGDTAGRPILNGAFSDEETKK